MTTGHVTERAQFVKNTLWYGLATVILRLRGFLLLPVFAKLLGPESYGLYIQASITVNLAMQVLSLRLDTAAVRFLSGESRMRDFSAHFTSMFTVVVGSTLLFDALALTMARWMAILVFGDAKYEPFVLLVACWITLSVWNSFLLNYYRVVRRIARLSIINLSGSLAEVAAIWVAVQQGFGIEGAILGVITASCFQALYLLITVFRDLGGPVFQSSGLGQFLAYSLPLTPNSLLLWSVNSSSRYIITYFLGLAAAGIYSASYSLANLVTLFYWPLSYVVFPITTKHWQAGQFSEVRNYFEYSMKAFLLSALPASAGLWYFSQTVLRSLATEEFAIGKTIVVILGLAFICQGIFQINVYVIHLVKKTQYNLAIILAGTTASVLFSLVLVPRMGVVGAALAVLVGYFVLAAVMLWWGRKELGYALDVRLLLKILVASGVMLLALSRLSPSSWLGITFASVLGATIYGFTLLLLRAFDKKELALAKHLIQSMLPHR